MTSKVYKNKKDAILPGYHYKCKDVQIRTSTYYFLGDPNERCKNSK